MYIFDKFAEMYNKTNINQNAFKKPVYFTVNFDY